MARPTVSWMRVAAILIVALVAWWGKRSQDPTDGRLDVPAGSTIEDFRAGEWLELEGRVKAKLHDDTWAPRHQRFLLEGPSGRTLLVVHNIDIAPRVPLETGDEVVVRGEYEPNEKGGLIHWTHRDPDGRRRGGWIRHEGKQYR